jgi:hypothetical protein
MPNPQSFHSYLPLLSSPLLSPTSQLALWQHRLQLQQQVDMNTLALATSSNPHNVPLPVVFPSMADLLPPTNNNSNMLTHLNPGQLQYPSLEASHHHHHSLAPPLTAVVANPLLWNGSAVAATAIALTNAQLHNGHLHHHHATAPAPPLWASSLPVNPIPTTTALWPVSARTESDLPPSAADAADAAAMSTTLAEPRAVPPNGTGPSYRTGSATANL